MRTKAKGVVLVVILLLLFPVKAHALILISEVLADPAAGLAGDSNNDGVRGTADDEFIELFNSGSAAVDVSGWSLSDSSSVRHVFPSSTNFSPEEIFVIWGGGSPQLPGISWQVASTGGLGLNNSGDVVKLINANGDVIDQFSYGAEGGKDQSLSRSPEGVGNTIVLHSDLPNAGGSRFSPGWFVNQPESDESQTVVPEIASIYSLGLAFGSILLKRKFTSH